MSVSSTTTKNSHSGNGSTTAFAYGFKIFADADLEVIIRASTGAETTKTLTTHYTVAGAGNDSGGTVTFTTGNTPASGETVVIRRKLTLTQGTDYVENDPFPADSHEDGLDRLTFIAQGIQEELDRSFKVSKTNSITTPEFVDDASTRASKLLGFSSDGNTLEATTGRVSTVSVSTVTPTAGAAGSATVSFTTSSGALALGIPAGSTGHAGISMQYSTTTADADPGAGFIRLNNASLNSATIMYVDDSDGTTDISAWVQSWDNSTSGSKGFITLAGNPNSASPLVIFKVTGSVTDASGYTKIPVAYVAGSTSITNNAEISVQFSPAGDGDVAGLDYTFSTTTTDSDPGTGVLRLNHGTLGSVSAIYIDDSDANSADVSAYLLTWDDSTNSADRGQIYITKKSAPANYAIYKVSGASTDASGYVKLAVGHVSSNGSFSDTDAIAVEFNRTGNAGDLADPTTTQHDIIVRGASAIERLAKGSNSTVLNTNASGALAYSQVSTAMIADDAVSLAKMASGTDGNLITYDASGNPAHVATGSSGQVLTSNGAGAAPTFSANVTDVSSDVRFLALQVASDRIGLEDGISDPFTDQTDVEIDLITAGSNVGDMTAAGGLAAAFDGTTSQAHAASAKGANDTGTSFVGKDHGSGVSKTITKYELFAPSDSGFDGDSGGSTITVSLRGSNSTPSIGSGTQLHTDNFSDSTGLTKTYTSGITTSTAYRYHWVEVSTNTTNTGQKHGRLAELKLYATGLSSNQEFDSTGTFYAPSSGTNMTLVSKSFTADAAPSNAIVGVQVVENESITINTDLTAEVSRDGGSNFTSCTLVLKTTLGATSTKYYESASTDISSQPSGTSMVYRIKTLNTKDIECHGVALRWS